MIVKTFFEVKYINIVYFKLIDGMNAILM